MAQVTYRGLPEFGLPLVGAEDPAFAHLLRKMESHPHPFFNWTEDDLQHAAILRNESGKAIIVLAHIWRYTTSDGRKPIGMNSNLGSSAQIGFLRGKTPLVRDLYSFILPGSMRLIGERAMFGSNLDVVPDVAMRGGRVGSLCGGRTFSDGKFVSMELVLDFALLEDGLCVGPGESMLFESITEGLERQRVATGELMEALHNGASAGQLFELLLPLARQSPGPPEVGKFRISIDAMFARNAIHQLTNLDNERFREWLEEEAVESPIHLHRPADHS